MEKGLHEKHRMRVLEEFLNKGFDIHTPPHKVLELLLFYCVPRRDTNELAHKLIDKYGSIAGVLDAPIDELAQMEYLSKRGAALLKLIIPLSNIYSFDRSNRVTSFSNMCEIGDYLFERMRNYDKEKLGVLLLGADGKLKSFVIMFEGTVNSVNVSVRDLIKLCLDKGAVIVALAHNHPSGVAIPSSDDVVLTERISSAFKNVGIKLIDHVVVVNDDYVSMADSPEYSHLFKN